MQRTGAAGVPVLVGTGGELGAGAGSMGAESAGGLLAKVGGTDGRGWGTWGSSQPRVPPPPWVMLGFSSYLKSCFFTASGNR